jgi:hypothetical protein
MKLRHLFWIAAAILPLTGCASYRGGTSDTTDTTSAPMNDSDRRPDLYPEPAGSPTFRPGANPDDIRDPNYFNHPRPPALGPQPPAP